MFGFFLEVGRCRSVFVCTVLFSSIAVASGGCKAELAQVTRQVPGTGPFDDPNAERRLRLLEPVERLLEPIWQSVG